MPEPLRLQGRAHSSRVAPRVGKQGLLTAIAFEPLKVRTESLNRDAARLQALVKHKVPVGDNRSSVAKLPFRWIEQETDSA